MIISIFKQKIKKQGKKIADMAGALFGNTNIPPQNDEEPANVVPKPDLLNRDNLPKERKKEKEVSKSDLQGDNNLPDPQPGTG